MSSKVPDTNEVQTQIRGLQQKADVREVHDQHASTKEATQSSVSESKTGKSSEQQQQLAPGISAESERLLEGLLTPAGSAHGSRRLRREDAHLHTRHTEQSGNTGSSGSVTSIVCLS